MNKKIIPAATVVIAIGIIVAILGANNFQNNETPEINKNEKLGLVINAPQSQITLQEFDEIYTKAASTGVGRSNVYMFWDLIEPQKGEYAWEQYDTIMALNEKNDFKVTLYFSLINGKTLGPFPNWIGKPSLISVSEDNLVRVLDAVLSRYHIIDSVIIAGGTDEHFRYQEQEIPVYEKLFNNVYDQIKEQHPNIKIGNSFELNNALNKNLEDLIQQLSFGDFVAITYRPTDTLNEINKTPKEAVDDLRQFNENTDKKIAIFEISWSTSEFVLGTAESQSQFIEEFYNFYDEFEEDFEFVTWYRLYDRPEGSCDVDESSLEGTVTLGNSTFVIQRLGSYICNAGLLTVNDTAKPSWNEFSNQIKLNQ